MTPAATRLSNDRVLKIDEETLYRLLGLTIMALVPALFWTGVLALAGIALGAPFSAPVLACTGAAIATFILTAMNALFVKLS
jgi:hypothetical protein